MTRTAYMIAAAVTVAIASMAVTAPDAEAKKSRGSTYKQWEFDSHSPLRGYEGFGSNPGEYCSYRREPERKCYFTSSGYEKCRIVSWRLIQKCY